jgi:hypothetical protein
MRTVRANQFQWMASEGRGEGLVTLALLANYVAGGKDKTFCAHDGGGTVQASAYEYFQASRDYLGVERFCF